MSHRTETAEFTVLCLIHDKDRILLQELDMEHLSFRVSESGVES